MKNLVKISQQTFWQILGKIVTSLSTFIVLGLVARNYGEEGTGVFTLSLIYLAIFYLLADFGFNAHILRKLKTQMSNVKNEWNRLLGTRVLWSGILMVFAIGLLPFWPFATSEFSKAVIIGSLAILGSSVFVNSNLIFQSKLRYDLSVLSSSAGAFVGLILFLYFISNKFPVSSLLIVHMLSWQVTALFALFLVKKIILKVFPIFDKKYIVDLFKQSWPIAATLALNVVYFRADSFLISYFRSNTEVGIYNVAYSVFQSILVLPTFIMNAYYPLMLKSLDKIKLVALVLLVLAFLGTIMILIFSPQIINILTGGGFIGSIQSLQILSLGFPAYFLSALFMWNLVTKGKYKTMLIIYAFGLIINLFLNFIYIPRYSFLAASWITVISEYLILSLQIASLLVLK